MPSARRCSASLSSWNQYQKTQSPEVSPQLSERGGQVTAGAALRPPPPPPSLASLPGDTPAAGRRGSACAPGARGSVFLQGDPVSQGPRPLLPAKTLQAGWRQGGRLAEGACHGASARAGKLWKVAQGTAISELDWGWPEPGLLGSPQSWA